MPERLNELTQWLRQDIGLPPFDIAPASSDASFRRYFRVRYADQSRIIMDAPPDKEDCGPFIAIARAFHALGLNVPEVLGANLERGFLLLTDLGHSQYLNELNETSAPRLYRDAMQALLALQRPKTGSTILLPSYDRPLLMREMALFRDWFMEQHLGLALDKTITDALDKAFDILVHSALEQPQVWVHRDYHSRNLMVTTQGNPGILDFQDAVTGPVTYDLASLLRDCYIAWPREQVEEWVENYHAQALKTGVISGVGAAQFLRWFDLMGVQRHLKAIGIFARLNIRDAKPGYLKDIPRTLGYVEEVSGRYPELAGLHALIHDRILTRIV